MAKLSNNPPAGGKVVLFDIDYTLFNTELLRGNLYRKMAESLGYEKRELEAIGKDVYEKMVARFGYFNPEYFIEELAKKINRQAEMQKMKEAVWNTQNFEGNFYKEVEKVLKALSQVTNVGIFSKGYNRFQRAKLAAIEHLLEAEHIHITVSKHAMLPKLLRKYRNNKLYLIDDALGVLFVAKKLRRDIFTIWVKRGRYALRQEPIEGFEPDATVTDLRGVVKLVQEN